MGEQYKRIKIAPSIVKFNESKAESQEVNIAGPDIKINKKLKTK